MQLFPSKRYGFTGTRKLDIFDPRHKANVQRVIDLVADGTEFTTGACRGIDIFLYYALKAKYPQAWHRVIVPWDKRQAVIPEEAKNTEIIYMPEGTTFRDRNKRILDFTDFLYVIPFDKLEVPYSGTWMTHNIAKDRKIPLEVISLCQE